MAREQREHRDKNPPNYRNAQTPRAENPEGCNADEIPVAPSSAAESRVRDDDGCTTKRPLTASKDEHEKTIGWRSIN
jgi:hypothetical protein